MKRTLAIGHVVIMMACTAWMISGCATTPTPPSPVQPSKPGVTKPAIAPKTVVPPLDAPSAEQDPKGRAQKLALHAVQMLQTGAADTAQAELQEAVRLDPDNKIAQSLLRQTIVDPVATLGSRHFLYRVQPSDTLSKIAQRFLGDLYQFYILARYNNIQNPSQLEVGTVIKIPGNAPAPAPATVSPAPAPESPPPESPSPVSKPKPNAKTLADLRVEQVYQSGLQALQKDEREKAYAAFTAALKLNPRHTQAAQKAEAVKQDMIQRYHKTAMEAFHRQDLDSAIKEWNKILVLDPGNESARLNRARALELRKRIQKFGK